jgi:hypothetical protein
MRMKTSTGSLPDSEAGVVDGHLGGDPASDPRQSPNPGRQGCQADVAAGAPTKADGTLSLLDYAAWLVATSTAVER